MTNKEKLNSIPVSGPDQLGHISMEELPSVGNGGGAETTPGEFNLKQEIIKEAEKAEQVSEQNGRCSKCGKKIGGRPRNFCYNCFGTFLTSEQIKRGEVYEN